VHYPRRLDTIIDEDFLAPMRELAQMLEVRPGPPLPPPTPATPPPVPLSGVAISGTKTFSIPKLASLLLVESPGPIDLTIFTEEDNGHTIQLTRSSQIFINPLVPGSILNADCYLAGKKLVIEAAKPVRVNLTWS
jgi:hypothetical protein